MYFCSLVLTKYIIASYYINYIHSLLNIIIYIVYKGNKTIGIVY